MSKSTAEPMACVVKHKTLIAHWCIALQCKLKPAIQPLIFEHVDLGTLSAGVEWNCDCNILKYIFSLVVLENVGSCVMLIAKNTQGSTRTFKHLLFLSSLDVP